MAILSTSKGQFAQTFTVNQQAGSYILLSTANKYVDKDIKITTNVKLATSAKDTASASTSLYTTDGSNAGINIGATSGVVRKKRLLNQLLVIIQQLPLQALVIQKLLALDGLRLEALQRQLLQLQNIIQFKLPLVL